jgi:hypothetical protein
MTALDMGEVCVFVFEFENATAEQNLALTPGAR